MAVISYSTVYCCPCWHPWSVNGHWYNSFRRHSQVGPWRANHKSMDTQGEVRLASQAWLIFIWAETGTTAPHRSQWLGVTHTHDTKSHWTAAATPKRSEWSVNHMSYQDAFFFLKRGRKIQTFRTPIVMNSSEKWNLAIGPTLHVMNVSTKNVITR